MVSIVVFRGVRTGSGEGAEYAARPTWREMQMRDGVCSRGTVHSANSLTCSILTCPGEAQRKECGADETKAKHYTKMHKAVVDCATVG
jgi:hypothetical protein